MPRPNQKNPNKPLIADPKDKEEWLQIEYAKLLLCEEIIVDTFINGLRHNRSHFLITKPSTMEEVRRTVIHITQKSQWNHKRRSSHSDSDDSSSDHTDSDSDQNSSSDSDSSMEEGFIKMKTTSKKKKDATSKREKQATSSTSQSTSTPKQGESNKIDTLIRQFGEMKFSLLKLSLKLTKWNKIGTAVAIVGVLLTAPTIVPNLANSVRVHWECTRFASAQITTIQPTLGIDQMPKHLLQL
jgi:hypothetical protein